MMVVWNWVVEADREQKTDLKYILEEVTGLNKRLGEEGKGKRIQDDSQWCGFGNHVDDSTS